MLQDIKYSLRTLLKRPGFTIVVVLALALGIGANSAIFSVVNTVLLKPLPYNQPDRLYMLWGENTAQGLVKDPLSFLNYLDWKERTRSFEDMAALTPQWSFNLTGLGEAQDIHGLFVTPNLFPMLGVDAARGRVFLPEEERADAGQVVLISHGMWQRAFGGGEALGKIIKLNDMPFTIVGIMAPDFEFLYEADVWVPMSPAMPTIGRFMQSRTVRLYQAVGRLKPDVDPVAAQAELNTVSSALGQQYPDTNQNLEMRMLPLHEEVTGSVRTSLLLLFGAVGLVLLIACANVANLVLTRSAGRRKEVSIRVALGAGRKRLIQQLLTESIMLAMIGGAAGLILAVWGVNALLAMSPESLPRQADIGIDFQMLGFTFLTALVTGVLFGLAPAIQASRQDQQSALKEGGRNMQSGSSVFRSAMVVTEIALALVLLVGSGLLVRSLVNVLEVDPGFRTDHLLTMTARLPRAVYGEPQQRAAFWRTVEERLNALPGVVSVGATTRLPLRGPNNNVTSTLTIEGQVIAEADKPEVDFRRSNPSYFRTMGIPLVNGREFTERDADERTVLINEAMAQRYFAGEDPVGKRIKLGSNSANADWIEIVGVVGNVRHVGLDTAPRPEVYRHLMSAPPYGPIWAIRTQTDPASLASTARNQIQALDADIPVSGIATMDELIDQTVGARRFVLQLLGLFAGLAMLLAVIGIYGVVSYAVAQQTHDIGVRMALGARAVDILRMVVGRGMLLTLIGLAFGVGGALVLTQFMAGMLYGISAADPITYVGIAVALALAALIANYIPARRATKVDPLTALRYE